MNANKFRLWLFNKLHGPTLRELAGHAALLKEVAASLYDMNRTINRLEGTLADSSVLPCPVSINGRRLITTKPGGTPSEQVEFEEWADVTLDDAGCAYVPFLKPGEMTTIHAHIYETFQLQMVHVPGPFVIAEVRHGNMCLHSLREVPTQTLKFSNVHVRVGNVLIVRLGYPARNEGNRGRYNVEPYHD